MTLEPPTRRTIWASVIVGWLVLALFAFIGTAKAQTFDPDPPGHLVTFCHVAGLEEDPANTITITADEHAVLNPQAGHFNEQGTPNAGHEQDYFGPCEGDVTPSPTPPPPTSPPPTTPPPTDPPTPPSPSVTRPPQTDPPSPQPPKDDDPWEPTWSPTWEPTWEPGGKPANLAETGSDALTFGGIALLLASLGSGTLWFLRKLKPEE